MVVVYPTSVKKTVFDVYILSRVFISKPIFTRDLRRSGLQFGLPESEIFYFGMLVLKPQKEVRALFCLQQMYLHLFLIMETLQLLPLSFYSQRLFKVEQWVVCHGRLLIEGLISHLLLYRSEIVVSEILFVLQSDVKDPLFSPFGEWDNTSVWDAKNNFIKTYPFHFLEHVKC